MGLLHFRKVPLRATSVSHQFWFFVIDSSKTLQHSESRMTFRIIAWKVRKDKGRSVRSTGRVLDGAADSLRRLRPAAYPMRLVLSGRNRLHAINGTLIARCAYRRLTTCAPIIRQRNRCHHLTAAVGVVARAPLSVLKANSAARRM